MELVKSTVRSENARYLQSSIIVVELLLGLVFSLIRAPIYRSGNMEEGDGLGVGNLYLFRVT